MYLTLFPPLSPLDSLTLFDFDLLHCVFVHLTNIYITLALSDDQDQVSKKFVSDQC